MAYSLCLRNCAIAHIPLFCLIKKEWVSIKKVSEYDQKIPQFHTAYQLMAPWGRNTRHQKDKQSKATSSPIPIKMIAKLERTHSNVQQHMEQTQNHTMGATTNHQQRNRRVWTTNLLIVICTEKQYSENVSIDAFDNNKRLKITSMLNMQDNTGISFYIVSIQV